jgi:hypothetical protein
MLSRTARSRGLLFVLLLTAGTSARAEADLPPWQHPDGIPVAGVGAVADTVVARTADGRQRRFEVLSCPATRGRVGFRRLDREEAGVALAGPHTLVAPSGVLTRAAELRIDEVTEGSRVVVRATVTPAEAVAGNLLLTLSYRGCAVGGNPSGLRILNLTSGDELPDAVHDPVNRTITATVRRFSSFILAEPL